MLIDHGTRSLIEEAIRRHAKTTDSSEAAILDLIILLRQLKRRALENDPDLSLN